MWKVKAKVTPVKIWETGTIQKLLSKYLSNIQGKQGIKEMQKTALFGIARILWRVLM
jgi:hypothetical protein